MQEEPLKVAHIVGKMVGGGVESFIMNYYRNIDRAKVQFDFIIDSDSTLIPREEIENLGGKIIEISPYQKIFSYMKELTKILKENNYTIVHSHLNTLSVFPLFCACCAKIPRRIAHSHSTTNKKEWKKNIIKNILKLFSKIFANEYYACSEYAGKWLFGDKTFEKGNVKIINNAIDINKFSYNGKIRDVIRKELNIENNLVLGHVGRFVKQKNHDFLIDVFLEVYKVNKNAVLLLIGEGTLEKEIKAKVTKFGIEKNVHFLGQRNDVNKLLQAMDVLVFPSLYEGLGMVLIEAQCSGLSCVVSNNVPKEVKINENVEFIDIKDSLNNWKEKVLTISNKREEINISKFENYNIKLMSKDLEKRYLEKV